MIGFIQQTRTAQTLSGALQRVQRRLAPALLRRRTFRASLIASVLAVAYWGIIASDRYVSEAHIVIQRTDLAGGQTMDFGGLLPGVGNVGHSDQLLLRDHLLSVDMLEKLDAKLNLREHFSDTARDPLSRLWHRDTPLERFHRYYLSRVSIEFDEYSGVLVIKTQAYDPETAHAIAALLVEEGERYMNGLAHRLAEEQVAFLEKQVAEMSERAIEARQSVVAFQNQEGLISPQNTAESRSAIIGGLETQLADLQARRTTLLGYLAPQAPGVVEVNLQIGAIEKQIVAEQARLAAPKGQTLNTTIEAFQRLQLAADFSQEVYKTALVALEKGRVEATRTLKKVSVLQSPTLPQYPLQPRRIYNIIVFALVALLLAGVAHLLAAIIRDHKD
ncbi:MAG: chain-length determining protein [Gammaproteobacteria bacterium]|jgi:capsular polysaccharide transport system permease protein